MSYRYGSASKVYGDPQRRRSLRVLGSVLKAIKEVRACTLSHGQQCWQTAGNSDIAAGIDAYGRSRARGRQAGELVQTLEWSRTLLGREEVSW